MKEVTIVWVASPDQWLFNRWVIPSEANFDSKWYWNNIRNLNYFMTRYQRVNATESEVNPVVAVIRFFGLSIISIKSRHLEMFLGMKRI